MRLLMLGGTKYLGRYALADALAAGTTSLCSTSVLDEVAASAGLLAPRAGHYVAMSSIAVYPR